MIILSITIVCFIVFFINYVKYESLEETICNSFISIFALSASIISGILFLSSIIVTPINTHKLIQQKESIVTTIESSNRNSIENAALIREVSDFNQELKIKKYYNSFWVFDIYYPNEIENVEPIKLNRIE